jgi:PAS domain S-box-containing protein
MATTEAVLRVLHPQVEEAFLAGGGEMGAMMRAFDWASSPLGPVISWPPSLRTVVSLCLNSQFPTVIFWGPDLVMLYNDGYLPMLADKHPASLGRPAQEVWSEIWSIIGPMLHGVLKTGQATWSYDLLLPIVHDGVAGEYYFTFSYSPIRDGTDTVRGVFCPVMETTARLQGERREQALRIAAESARDQVSHILESMSDSFVAFDSQWRITTVNASAAEALHHRREDLLGKVFWEEFPPIRDTNFNTEVRRAMADRVPIEFESYYPPWERWYEVHAYPAAEGSLSVFFRDITARKQAEEVSLRLAAIVESSDDAVISKSLAGIVTSWNAAAERIFGYRAEEMIGQSILQLLPEGRQDEEDMILERLRQGERIDHFETVRRAKDGRLLEVSVTISPLRDARGTIIGASKVARDITARKKAEEALHKERELLQAIVDTVPAMLTVYEPDTKVMRLNREFERVLGWSTPEAAGASLMEQCYPDPAYREQIRLFMESCREGWMDIRMRTRAGRDVETSWANVRLSNKTQIGIGIDITARKEAEEAQVRLTTELQRINDELQQFAYIVSHDLNEPLRTIRNFITLLAREYQGKLDANADEYIAFVTDGTQRMQDLLRDLLAYTRVSGQAQEFTAVGGEELLARVLAGLQVAIIDAEAEITHDPLPTVRGDAIRLGQVLQNLIGNALKFRSKAPLRIHVSAQREGTHWRFAVQDNGIGIDPRQADRIFQVFRRLHTRREYPGTGMGLAICKKIVEQHGGRIWVDSHPGEGSIFYFTISDTTMGKH